MTQVTKISTLNDLRRLAVTQSLFAPTSLNKALDRLGFVQADPIRAPARAQDLILRHRVKDYRAGQLEARYARLAVEEDFFVNYGFVSPSLYGLMHPRTAERKFTPTEHRRAADLRAFVAERGVVHPREADAHFAHGAAKNGWGGSSNATTDLLDRMHYRGMLRVAGRIKGIRLYTLPRVEHSVRDAVGADAALDQLIDVLFEKYAPLAANSMSGLLNRLRWGVPQWRGRVPAAIARAKARHPSAVIDGVRWYWPAGNAPLCDVDDRVRLLAPFDPVVWDRTRFEMLWGWAYRFEAYTPAAKRKLGYYALPVLWREHIIGWANAAVDDGRLQVQIGFVAGRAPRDKLFKAALQGEVNQLAAFLAVSSAPM